MVASVEEAVAVLAAASMMMVLVLVAVRPSVSVATWSMVSGGRSRSASTGRASVSE